MKIAAVIACCLTLLTGCTAPIRAGRSFSYNPCKLITQTLAERALGARSSGPSFYSNSEAFASCWFAKARRPFNGEGVGVRTSPETLAVLPDHPYSSGEATRIEGLGVEAESTPALGNGIEVRTLSKDGVEVTVNLHLKKRSPDRLRADAIKIARHALAVIDERFPQRERPPKIESPPFDPCLVVQVARWESIIGAKMAEADRIPFQKRRSKLSQQVGGLFGGSWSCFHPRVASAKGEVWQTDLRISKKPPSIRALLRIGEKVDGVGALAVWRKPSSFGPSGGVLSVRVDRRIHFEIDTRAWIGDEFQLGSEPLRRVATGFAREVVAKVDGERQSAA